MKNEKFILSYFQFIIQEYKFQSHYVGELLQLIDDISDVNDDIHTIVTYDLQHKGVLDDLWIDIVSRINSVPPKFNPFKIGFSVLAIYILYKFTQNIIPYNQINDLISIHLSERETICKSFHIYFVSELNNI